MKHEWKKHEKAVYGAKKMPSVIYVPSQKYIMISGWGDPNGTDFSERVSALYTLAYGIKMGYKSSAAAKQADIHDYTVYPLEGIWWKNDDGKELIKAKLNYTIMIRQPDFITKDMVSTVLEKVKRKKNNPLFSEISFETMQDGLCIEILHIGSFDEEPASFALLDEFAKNNGLIRIENCHREVYMNNAKRVLKSRLKTILRYRVKKA